MDISENNRTFTDRAVASHLRSHIPVFRQLLARQSVRDSDAHSTEQPDGYLSLVEWGRSRRKRPRQLLWRNFCRYAPHHFAGRTADHQKGTGFQIRLLKQFSHHSAGLIDDIVVHISTATFDLMIALYSMSFTEFRLMKIQRNSNM